MRRFAPMLAALALTLVGAGCAGPDALEATAPPSVEVAGGLSPERIWRRGVGASAGGEDRLQPAHANGRLFVASADGTLLALDPQNGSTLWRRELERPLSGGPAARQGLVVIGTRKGEVLALAVEDGETRWISGVTSEVLAPAAIGRDTVVVRTNDGRVFALESASGERRWLYDRNVPTLSIRGYSAPALAEGGVMVGFDNGRLVALSLAEGTPVWEASVAVPRGQTDLDQMVDIDADPLVRRDAVFAAAYQGRIAGVAVDGGQVAWAREFSSHAGLALAGTRLVAPDTDGKVWAFDPSNGASLWRQDALSGQVLAAPAIHAGNPVVAGSDGYLTWLAADDGRILARRRVADSRITVGPLVVEDRLYVLAADGELQAWKLDEG